MKVKDIARMLDPSVKIYFWEGRTKVGCCYVAHLPEHQYLNRELKDLDMSHSTEQQLIAYFYI